MSRLFVRHPNPWPRSLPRLLGEYWFWIDPNRPGLRKPIPNNDVFPAELNKCHDLLVDFSLNSQLCFATSAWMTVPFLYQLTQVCRPMEWGMVFCGDFIKRFRGAVLQDKQVWWGDKVLLVNLRIQNNTNNKNNTKRNTSTTSSTICFHGVWVFGVLTKSYDCRLASFSRSQNSKRREVLQFFSYWCDVYINERICDLWLYYDLKKWSSFVLVSVLTVTASYVDI